MEQTNKYVTLSMDVCFKCESLPVKFSSWEGEHQSNCPVCKQRGIDNPLVQMEIKIPASLLNDEAYSPFLLSRWADNEKFM